MKDSNHAHYTCSQIQYTMQQFIYELLDLRKVKEREAIIIGNIIPYWHAIPAYDCALVRLAKLELFFHEYCWYIAYHFCYKFYNKCY